MATSLIGSDGLAGVYWQGNDGSTYTKNNLGQVTNAGAYAPGPIAPGANATISGLQYRAIADPSAPTAPLIRYTPTGPGGNDSATYSSTGGTGTTAAAAAPAPDLSAYDQAISTYNNQIGRLPAQFDIAKGNIVSQFNTNQNELNSAKTQAQNTYDSQTTQNGQQLRTSKNTIADQASAGLRGLLRTLGAYGAGGSSDALYNAPGAVANQASIQRSGAGQTFAHNAQNLDTNWNNFLTQDGTSRQKLNDWQTQQINSAQAQSESTKQSLLTKLADLVGQRTAAAGGRYATGAQPYIDQANSLGTEIDNLGRLNPTYNGTTPTYTAPSLDSYNAGSGTAAELAQNASNNPYLALLLGQNKNKNPLGA